MTIAGGRSRAQRRSSSDRCCGEVASTTLTVWPVELRVDNSPIGTTLLTNPPLHSDGASPIHRFSQRERDYGGWSPALTKRVERGGGPRHMTERGVGPAMINYATVSRLQSRAYASLHL